MSWLFRPLSIVDGLFPIKVLAFLLCPWKSHFIMMRFSAWPAMLLLLPLLACSILNAPDEVMPQGTGGGAQSSATTGNGGSGGMAQGGGGTGGIEPMPVCGNGVLETGEECDDGNQATDDACSATCGRTVFDIAADSMLINDGPNVGAAGVDNSKGFMVVWRETDPAGGVVIKTAPYRASGLRVSDPIVVSTTPGPSKPKMGSNSLGRSVVGWKSSSDGDQIRFRSIAADGSLIGPADTLISGSQALTMSNIAAKSGNEFCMIWQAPGAMPNMRSRCFDPMGSVAVTQTQTIGGTTGVGNPGIWGAATRFVAAWVHSDGILKGRILDATGMAIDVPFVLPSNGNQNQNPVGVDAGPAGQHVVIFEQLFNPGPNAFNRITKREFQTTNNSTVLDSFVSSSMAHDEVFPSAAAANGKFVVAWTDNDVNFGDIIAQAFNLDGSRIGNPFVVNIGFPAGTQRFVNIATNSDGDCMFVWESEQAGSIKVSALVYPRLLQ